MEIIHPKISVLMPVYNCEKFLNRSIDSILNQTFDNFEYIIINDGSTDNSFNIIKSYKDKRIKIINNSKNIGISRSLNKGINYATGEYLARHDADDISDLDRLKLQLEYLDKNDVDLVDTSIAFIDKDDNYLYDYEERNFMPEETLSHLFFYEINHGTILCKRSLIEKNKIQYLVRPAEDYCLFTRLGKRGMKAGRIEKPIVRVREREDSLCGSNWINVKNDIDQIRIELLKGIDLKPSDYEKKIHIALVDQDLSILSKYKFEDVLGWSNKIVDGNSLHKTYSINYMKNQLYLRIIRLIKHIKRRKFSDLLRLKKSAVKYDMNISFKDLFYLYRY